MNITAEAVSVTDIYFKYNISQVKSLKLHKKTKIAATFMSVIVLVPFWTLL